MDDTPPLDETGDTCRICSGGAEPNAPLYRPCLCRGSIGHIHQDCLATWLSHSKKRSCDVCKHPYAFTKVYARDMPRRLPALLLMRRAARHACGWIGVGLRGVIVGVVWLALLPWATLWTWRMYFAIGNGAAGWLAAKPLSGHRALFNLTRHVQSNVTAANSTVNSTASGDNATESSGGVRLGLLAHPAARNIGADILSGQIIATLIVLVFIAVFLLKEWIAQNARPGILDDAPPNPQPNLGAEADVEDEDQPAAEAEADPAAEAEPALNEEEELKKEMDAERARIAVHLHQHDKSRSSKSSRNNAFEPEVPGPDGTAQRPFARLPRRARRGVPPLVALPAPQPEDEGEGREESVRKRARAGASGFSFANENGSTPPWLGSPSSPPLPFPLSPSSTSLAGSSSSVNIAGPSIAGPSNDTLGATPSGAPHSQLAFRSVSTTAVAGTPAVTTPASDWSFAPPYHAEVQRFGSGSSTVNDTNGSGHVRRRPNAPGPISHAGLAPTRRGPVPSPNRIAFRSTSSPAPTPPIPPPLTQATASAPIPSPRLSALTSSSSSSTPSSTVRPTQVTLPRRPPLVSSAPASPALPSSVTATRRDASPGLASYAAPEVLGEEGYFDYSRAGSGETVKPTDMDDAAKGKGKGKGRSTDDEKEEEERVEVWNGDETLREDGDGREEVWASWEDADVRLRRILGAEHAKYFGEPSPPSPSDGDEERDEDLEGMPPLEGIRHDHNHDHDHEHHDHEHHDHELEDHDLEHEHAGGMFGWEDDDADVDADDLGGEGEGDDMDNDHINALRPPNAPNPNNPPPNALLGPAFVNRPAPANLALPPDPAPPAPPAGAGGGGFADDFADAEPEDDMDGALEAIGMRGPWHIVAQNAALMVFVLDTAIGLGVWLPFTLGKTLGLLSLNPARALVLIHAPVKLVRVVTDPGVDGAVFVVRRVVGPVVLKVLMPLVHLLEVEGKAHGGWTEKIAMYIGALGASKPVAVPVATPAPSSFLDSPYVQRLLASPLVLKATSHPFYTDNLVPLATRLWNDWTVLVTSDTPSSRAAAVGLGYGAVAFVLVMWLNVFSKGSVRSAGRAVGDAIRQWGLVVKVAAFILIELVLFPLGCGLTLDACSVWMFPGASLQTRIAFAKQSPLTSAFYHWVIGTMFMYQFAILLAGARTIMRPGAMWFIKDPSDANFHPIRDILERPALLQLRKLLFSAVMYATVLTAGVASVGVVARGLLPIRWLPREPLSDIPLDLLVLHVLLPYTTRHFRPKRPLKRFAGQAWRWSAARLGLSGYMFGARVTAEEAAQGGGWRRVPASDNVVVPRGVKATAQVDKHGAAAGDAELRTVAAQNLAARRAGRDPKVDYTVVHVPTHFKLRITLFLASLWIAGCVAFSLALCLPLLVGRQIFAIALGSERMVHDGYSLLAGFYALWAAFFVGWHAEHRYLRRVRMAETEDEEPISRTQHVLRACKGFAAWAGKAGYMAVMLGGVIPILMAAVIECYCVLPMRVLMTPGEDPVRIRIVDLWALGLVYLKILARGRLIRLQAQRAAQQQQQQQQRQQRQNGAAVAVEMALGEGPPRRERGRAIARGVANIRARGWLRPDPVRATREVIGPLVAGLLAMLLGPPLFAYGLVLLLGEQYVPINGPLGYLQIYPLIFTGVALGQLITAGVDVFVTWSRAVRDREYLVELRLRNFDQQTVPKDGVAGDGTDGGARDGVEERDVGADEIADDELALVARVM